MHNWTFLLGPGFADGIGTGLILGWLMYKSGLVGRRMALVGVVGGAMLATSGVAVLLGVIPQGGAVQGIATIPEIIWEAFLGLYLLFKDFKPSALAALASDSRNTIECGAGNLVADRRRDDGGTRHDRHPRADASDRSAVVRPHRLGAAPCSLPAQRGALRPLAAGGRQAGSG